jgi:hypothetical protein
MRARHGATPASARSAERGARLLTRDGGAPSTRWRTSCGYVPHLRVGAIGVVHGERLDDLLMFSKFDLRPAGFGTGTEAIELEPIIKLVHQELLQPLVRRATRDRGCRHPALLAVAFAAKHARILTVLAGQRFKIVELGAGGALRCQPARDPSRFADDEQ